MRNFAKIPPRFWSSPLGLSVRSQGQPTLLTALYLLTCPHASMLGFYYIPLPTITHETASPSLEGTLEVLQRLASVRFAHYDREREEVWVPEMADMQIGTRLQITDNLVTGLINELIGVRSSPFYKKFMDRYAQQYRLLEKAQSLGINMFYGTSSKAPSKDHTSPPGSLSLSPSLSRSPSLSLSLSRKASKEPKPPASPQEAPSGLRPAANSNGNGHKRPADTAAVWAAYCGSYRARYGEPPVRNVKVNGQLAALLKRLSAEEAPEVAKFYVQSGNQFYVTHGHAVDYLLRDAEKLRMEWKTGKRITASAARTADQREERGGIAAALLDKAAQEREGVNA